jgi:hypothetical protein
LIIVAVFSFHNAKAKVRILCKETSLDVMIFYENFSCSLFRVVIFGDSDKITYFCWTAILSFPKE